MRISDWSSDVCSSDLCATNAGSSPAVAIRLPCTNGTLRRAWTSFSTRDGVSARHCLLSSARPSSVKLSIPASIETHPACPSRSSMSGRSEEHTSELQSLMRISYAVFCLKKKTKHIHSYTHHIIIINHHINNY